MIPNLPWRLIAESGIVLALCIVAFIAVKQHDHNIVAAQQTKQEQAVIAKLQQDAAQLRSILNLDQQHEQELQTRANQLQAAINAAPNSNGCARSAAIRALIERMRQHTAGH